MSKKSTYKEIKPKAGLKNFVHSFWQHKNADVCTTKTIILPDSYFKIVIAIKHTKIITYFITGIWTKEKFISIAPNTTIYGCRFKILAPEFLLNREIASILNKFQQLDLQFLNVKKFNLSSFETFVEDWQNELIKRISLREIQENKLRLSHLLETFNTEITATEVSKQIFWTNRQINRYLNKYLGVSLKRYLNIQKCYRAFFQIREGIFFPDKGYFDQAHFIREVKKHTGETPRNLYKSQNDRFIQLKRMKKD